MSPRELLREMAGTLAFYALLLALMFAPLLMPELERMLTR